MKKKDKAVSLRKQSSETKPSTKLVLVSRDPFLYLEFNKSYRQNVSKFNSFTQNSTFLSLKLTVDTLIDVRNET